MKKFTKIVATVSDRRCDIPFLMQLFENGLNVVRMNSAHLDLTGFQRIVSNVRAVSPEIGILMDTKGPEIRTTTLAEGLEHLTINDGDHITIAGDPGNLTTPDRICLSYRAIASDVTPGMHLLVDDGEIDFEILSITSKGELRCVARNNGELGSRKSVNIPGAKIKLPSLTDRDRVNIGHAIDLGIDFIAHSFVRSAADVHDIQKILDSRNSKIKIISKIENQEGIDNIDEIIEASYGIMVARGDLGIEIAAERIPAIQRMIIDKCIHAHKPVIVATQMLHSMINNPRPTRAEVSDIANAVSQRSDALMLSGETAYGRYPVEALATMARIAREAEKDLPSGENLISPEINDTTSFLARQAVASCPVLHTRAILTDSFTGRTARYIASFRGKFPTVAICYREPVIRLLALSYGVIPLYQPKAESSRRYLRNALLHLIEEQKFNHDDLIAYLGGGFGEGRGTTFLEINRIGEVMDNYATYSLPNLEDVAQPVTCENP